MLHYKDYKTYADYTEDQVAKLKLRADYVRQKSARKLSDFIRDFIRFDSYIPDGCRVLCLGARFGEEVKAFRKLGYDAIGIDLYADESDLVVKGDWNNLPFEKEFDVIYTNSIDHAFSMDTLYKQIKKALKPEGKIIIALDQNHVHAGNDRMIEKKFASPDRYEAMLWNNDVDVTNAFVGYDVKMLWLERRWHTYLLERDESS